MNGSRHTLTLTTHTAVSDFFVPLCVLYFQREFLRLSLFIFFFKKFDKKIIYPNVKGKYRNWPGLRLEVQSGSLYLMTSANGSKVQNKALASD